MSAEKKITELKDEQLEEVSGGKNASPGIAATFAIYTTVPTMGVDNEKIELPCNTGIAMHGAIAQDDTE